jgi:hypothetical protein
MRLIPLAGFDADLRPISPAQLARREAIAAEMERVAKASESELPADERRMVIDVREGFAALAECGIACACAAPVAFGLVIYIALP